MAGAPDDRIQRVVMPKWGLSMVTGKVTGWIVSEGDTVAKGDDLAEVETDKISGELESLVAGPIRVVITPTGSDVPVGGTLALVAGTEVSDDDVAAEAARVRAELEELAVAAEEGDAGPPQETVTVDGRQVAYVTLNAEGSGAPTVLVHGFGGDRNSWLFVQEALAADGPLHALDLPGHGASSKDVGDGSLATLAATVTGFLDALDLSDAHLVGHSLGGAVVAAAAGSSGRVGRLTLLAPAGFSADANADYLRGFAATNSRKELRALAGELFADPDQVTRQLVADLLAYKRLDGVSAALGAIVGTLVDGDGHQVIDGSALLDGSSVPVTVVWGADDRILPASGASGAGTAVGSRGSVTTVDGAGHMVHMEAPNDTLRAMGVSPG